MQFGFQTKTSFSTDTAKVNYIIGLFRGRALAWAEAMNLSVPLSSLTFRDFESSFKSVFDHPSYAGTASSRLLGLHQGSRSVADYSEFRTLAAETRWNDEAL